MCKAPRPPTPHPPRRAHTGRWGRESPSEQVRPAGSLRASQSRSGFGGLFPGATRAGPEGNCAPSAELEVAHQGKSGSERNVLTDGC